MAKREPKTYCDYLQDAEEGHAFRVGYDDIRRRLLEGERVFWRTCRVCRQPIYLDYASPTAVVRLLSCGCRPEECSTQIFMSWDDLEKAVNQIKSPQKG